MKVIQRDIFCKILSQKNFYLEKSVWGGGRSLKEMVYVMTWKALVDGLGRKSRSTGSNENTGGRMKQPMAARGSADLPTTPPALIKAERTFYGAVSVVSMKVCVVLLALAAVASANGSLFILFFLYLLYYLRCLDLSSLI